MPWRERLEYLERLFLLGALVNTPDGAGKIEKVRENPSARFDDSDHVSVFINGKCYSSLVIVTLNPRSDSE